MYCVMIKSQEYIELLDRLLNPKDHTIKIDLSVLKQICATQDYKRLIDVTSIFFKLFFAGRRHLSIRQLISHSPLAIIKPSEQEIPDREEADFLVDELSQEELMQLSRQLYGVRKKLKNTVYSLRLFRIIETLRQVGQGKKEGEGSLCVGDYELMEEEYKKFSSGNVLQVMGQSKHKIDQFLKNPRAVLDGRFSNFCTLQKLILEEVLPILERSILSIPLNNHTEREGELSRVLKFIHSHVVVQYQVEIEISKNTLVETRIYHNKIYKQLLLNNQRAVVKALHKILNEAILSPSSINIQILLLRVLRRLYLLWEYATAHSSEQLQHFRPMADNEDGTIVSMVRTPLFLTLRNIALFSSGREEELKEAAMLCYKIIQDKNDLELITMLQDCDQIRFLKNSKFYSSKAYVYADEVEKIYEPAELGSLYWKNHQFIAARQIWVYNVLVQKPSSLVCWQFYLGGFDIRFGVYKLEQLRELTLEEYEKGTGCKQILKLQRVQNLSADAHKGHLYLKSGFYRLVFDNSFSMMRGKELFYSFLHFESNS